MSVDGMRRFYADKVFMLGTSRPWNLLANAASILGLVFTVLAAARWDVLIIPIVYLCLLSAMLIWRYVRQERRARYGEAQALVANCFRLAQGANEFMELGDDGGGMFLERFQALRR